MKDKIIRLFETNNMIDCSVAISICISKKYIDREVETYIRKHLTDERANFGYKVKYFAICALLLLKGEDLRMSVTDQLDVHMINRMLSEPIIFDVMAN